MAKGAECPTWSTGLSSLPPCCRLARDSMTCGAGKVPGPSEEQHAGRELWTSRRDQRACCHFVQQQQPQPQPQQR
jgi:hypothetical protein